MGAVVLLTGVTARAPTPLRTPLIILPMCSWPTICAPTSPHVQNELPQATKAAAPAKSSSEPEVLGDGKPIYLGFGKE